jgi:hypothetical protein
VGRGRIDVLEYLDDKGCPSDLWTC